MSQRALQFLLFFSIAVSIYTGINSYVFLRGWSIVPPEYHLQFSMLYVFVAFSFLAGRALERVMLNWITTSLVFIGAYWLAAFAYLLIIVYLIDVVRLLNYMAPFLPNWFAHPTPEMNLRFGAVVLGFVGLLLTYGHVNARTIRIKTLDIAIPKKTPNLSSMNIAVASDIHLGTIICKSRLEKIVHAINGLKPDLVLFPGDVVDEDLAPVIKQNLGETLRTIKSKFGIISITGNHEYIGGAEEAIQYLTEHGITVLRDSVLKIADSLFIVGRDDVSGKQFMGRIRAPLSELMNVVDKTLPIILMDHQPFRLNEAEENGVDVQLSGHTHNGQLWPFNYLAKRIFEVSWGYKKKGNTHVYVSSGVGTWGPPLKIGNDSEIIHLKLSFGN